MSRHSVRPALLTIAAILVSLGLLAAPARAGLYTVSGTCGQWSATGSGVAIYPACPALVARNSGPATTPYAVGGGWRFDAPPGTEISSANLQASLSGGNGWQAVVHTEGNSVREVIACPGLGCPLGSAGLGQFAGYGAQAIAILVHCIAPAGCSGAGVFSEAILNASTITLADWSSPSASLSGGSIVTGGWKSVTQTLTVAGTDNTGIREFRVVIDGVQVVNVGRACDYSQKVPCSNGQATLQFSLAGLADGKHWFAGQVVDASGSVGSTEGVDFFVDNTPPTRPLDVQVSGGAGWRAQNKISVRWRNPRQSAAPISGAAYRVCPQLPLDADAKTTVEAQTRCRTGSRSGSDLSSIDDLELPGPGLWRLELWLIDSAGNQQPASAVDLDGLGYDDSPPEAVAFASPDPRDPARVRVVATDPVSGLASGVIEVRRQDETAWQPLATQIDAAGLNAFMDDEALPKGLYFLRARVTDAAGLESSNDRTADGQPATLKLPIRLASRVTAGRRGARRCRGHGKERHCHNQLVTRPTVRVGRQTRLYGRLTVAGKALSNTPVQVWRRLDLDGAGWAQIATVSTSRTGRFSYLARRGPARTIRFRYPGTAQIRGRNGDVALRVPAATSFRPSRRTVINGEYVTFRGQLRGGWVPSTGALVELQVRTRGRWRTFAQPRASARTGRWSYNYRFETVHGRARFTFRARVRRQPGLPFTTGNSHAVHVSVHGL